MLANALYETLEDLSKGIWVGEVPHIFLSLITEVGEYLQLEPLYNHINPLSNLKWNDKDKIWMNHKLFNEKMEKIYPELNP